MILLIFERCPTKTGHTTRVDSITVGNGELFVIAEGQHTLARVMRCIRVGSLSETELPCSTAIRELHRCAHYQ